MDTEVSQNHLLKICSFLLCILLASLPNIRWLQLTCTPVWAFCFVLQVFCALFMSVSCYLCYYGSAMYLEIWNSNPSLLVFVQAFFHFPWPFVVPFEFSDSFSICAKNIWGICLELHWICKFVEWSFSQHLFFQSKCIGGLFLCLISSLISFFRDLQLSFWLDLFLAFLRLLWMEVSHGLFLVVVRTEKAYWFLWADLVSWHCAEFNDKFQKFSDGIFRGYHV